MQLVGKRFDANRGMQKDEHRQAMLSAIIHLTLGAAQLVPATPNLVEQAGYHIERILEDARQLNFIHALCIDEFVQNFLLNILTKH